MAADAFRRKRRHPGSAGNAFDALAAWLAPANEGLEACPRHPARRDLCGENDRHETERIILEIESRLHRLIESSRRQSGPAAQSSVLAAAAEACAARRKLYALFGRRLFSDPSWDILLELFVSTLEGRKVTVSTACMAACAPSTTALRHIAYLVQEGLIVRCPHPADARSTYLELTGMAASRLTQYFSETR